MKPLHAIRRITKTMWARCNDRILNIYTEDYKHIYSESETSSSSWKGRQANCAKYADNRAYATVDYFYLRKVLRFLDPGPQDVLYDIGSGLGRVVCLAAKSNVRRCVGIELFADMCEHARKNVKALRGRKAPIDIVCEDAATANLHGGTIYFFFNPFGAETMNRVIEAIGRTLENSPRRIRIVYLNPTQKSIVESCHWLEEYSLMISLNGMRISFYRNKSECVGVSG